LAGGHYNPSFWGVRYKRCEKEVKWEGKSGLRRYDYEEEINSNLKKQFFNRRVIMKTCKLVMAFIAIIIVCPATVWGYGMYNWYGGYTTSTATAWNGGTSASWSYGSTGWGWSWGSGCYASTYARAGSSWDSDTSWGWSGAHAESHASAPGKSADAWADAYNASWLWWNSGGYTHTVATTSGTNTYATAYARASSNWWYTYLVPRTWWNNTWVPVHGWRIPYYMQWYYWGWLDPMSTEMILGAEDILAGTSTTLLEDGFIDNGDGTVTQVGDDLDIADLVYDPDVDGAGHAGYNIMGHSGEIETDEPYLIPFLITATEIGGDTEYIELRVDFSIDGYIGQIPEPATIILLAAGLLGIKRRK
jgi:hypothetical protein